MKALMTALALVIVQPSLVYAGGRATSCAEEKAKKAEAVVATLKNWTEVWGAYRRFGECDDGAIAEGFTEVVTQIMATDWESLPQLQQITSKDEDFSHFVLRHIDASADPSHLQKILENARIKCPRQAEQLCGQIKMRSASVIDRLK